MTQGARVVGQAKVNLLLRVLGREANGYHAIETIFLRLALADDIRVRVADGWSLDCEGPAIPDSGLGPTERNLAFRAARAYIDATGWPRGFAIEIDKRIPVGGGLGGGSADAGAVLRALDAMSPKPLGPRLIELATALGADVPFMAIEHPMALGWGRGERLLSLPTLPSRPVLLSVPNFGISAADAYTWLSADRGEYVPQSRLLDESAFATWEGVTQIAKNDLEPVVARRHPVIAELVAGTRSAGALLSMMSGSGSTVLGVFSSLSEVPAQMRHTGVTTILTSTSERVVRVELEQ